MAEFEKFWCIVLLIVSVILVVVPFADAVVRFIYYKCRHFERARKNYRGMLFWTGSVLLSVWALRFAVALYFPYCPKNMGVIGLAPWEEFFNSMVHALQTLSMDEDYTLYIQAGRALMVELVGETTVLADIYGVYASLLNAAAPVLGGAILFEILANVFPSIRLRATYVMWWRETCYFSELNEASLALARSLLSEKHPPFCSPVIVFTDAYADREKEKDNELLAEAKRIGAICVQADMIHVAKTYFGARSFFLIDMNEGGNLHTLTELTEKAHASKLKRAKIYLFVKDDAYVRLERQVRERLLNESFKGRSKNLPTIIPVQSERNLVANLFADVPLYEPLIGVESDKTVNVTILGDGGIGMQALLTAYWMGQLPDHSLNIHVVAKEEEADFYARLDYINPEIRQSTMDGHPLLWQGDGFGFGRPYCHIDYTKADVMHGPFWDVDADDKNGVLAKRLLETNYFVVALGSDADNIEVADRLRVFLGRNRIRAMDPNGTTDPIRTVIAYAVYDSTVAQALNRQQRYRSCIMKSPDACDVYMVAFGSLQEVYSVKNIRMSTYSLQAEETGNKYRAEKAAVMHQVDNQERRGDKFDSYSYWSNLARAMHLKYKVFALGVITESVFTCSDQVHDDAVRDACRWYKWLAVTAAEKPDAKDAQDKREECTKLATIPEAFGKRFEAERQRVAWLEHRRWNAFLRSCGFRSAALYDTEKKKLQVMVAAYYEKERENAHYETVNEHKNLLFKLHPMLVECPQEMDAQNYLDEVSDVIAQVMQEERKDYKRYDGYMYEFAKHYTVEEAKTRFGLDERTVRNAQEQYSSDPSSLKDDGPMLISAASLLMYFRKHCRWYYIRNHYSSLNSLSARWKLSEQEVKDATDAAKAAGVEKLYSDYYLTRAQMRKVKATIQKRRQREKKRSKGMETDV